MKLKNILKQLWKDESAQGLTEYILLVVVVVALFAIFKDRIKPLLTNIVEKLSGDVQNAAQ